MALIRFKYLSFMTLIFSFAIIGGCAENREYTRKKMYTGSFRPISETAIMLDEWGERNPDEEALQETYKTNSFVSFYVYSIDGTIIYNNENEFRKNFSAWTNIAYDLLPGNHLIKLITRQSRIFVPREKEKYFQDNLYYTIPYGITINVEFYSEPGKVYCPRIYTTHEEYYRAEGSPVHYLLASKVLPCVFQKHPYQVNVNFVTE